MPQRAFTIWKGKLDWPVSGKVVIPYGAQKDAQFNTPVFRNGIHIKQMTIPQQGSAWRESRICRLVQRLRPACYNKPWGRLSHPIRKFSRDFYKVGDIIKGTAGRRQGRGIRTLNAPGLYFEVRYKGETA